MEFETYSEWKKALDKAEIDRDTANHTVIESVPGLISCINTLLRGDRLSDGLIKQAKDMAKLSKSRFDDAFQKELEYLNLCMSTIKEHENLIKA